MNKDLLEKFDQFTEKLTDLVDDWETELITTRHTLTLGEDDYKQVDCLIGRLYRINKTIENEWHENMLKLLTRKEENNAV